MSAMSATAHQPPPAVATPASTRTVGFISAVLCTVFALAYDLGQIAEWLGWLGSAGGPESASTPFGLAVLLTPSLLLGSAFLILMVSLHQATPVEGRVWSHGAVAFATVYTVLISGVYFVQLTLVAPRLASGRTAGIEPFVFVPFDSYLYAMDILGYSFMSLSTLFAARALRGDGVERVARVLLTANGLLVPFLVFQLFVHQLIWIAALWAVSFPGATWALALWFRRKRESPAS
jgi:hypothetical protein